MKERHSPWAAGLVQHNPTLLLPQAVMKRAVTPLLLCWHGKGGREEAGDGGEGT